jgi:hypothetical protein
MLENLHRFACNEATQSSGGLCQAFCRGLQCVRLSAQRGHSIERRFVPGILPGLAVCQAFCPTRPLNRAAVCARHSAGACSVSGFLPNEATQSSGGLCQAFCRGLQCVRLSVQRGHSIERWFVPGILPGLAVCQARTCSLGLYQAR